jgi:hypothetical protein
MHHRIFGRRCALLAIELRIHVSTPRHADAVEPGQPVSEFGGRVAVGAVQDDGLSPAGPHGLADGLGR